LQGKIRGTKGRQDRGRGKNTGDPVGVLKVITQGFKGGKEQMEAPGLPYGWGPGWFRKRKTPQTGVLGGFSAKRGYERRKRPRKQEGTWGAGTIAGRGGTDSKNSRRVQNG